MTYSREVTCRTHDKVCVCVCMSGGRSARGDGHLLVILLERGKESSVLAEVAGIGKRSRVSDRCGVPLTCIPTSLDREPCALPAALVGTTALSPAHVINVRAKGNSACAWVKSKGNYVLSSIKRSCCGLP